MPSSCRTSVGLGAIQRAQLVKPPRLNDASIYMYPHVFVDIELTGVAGVVLSSGAVFFEPLHRAPGGFTSTEYFVVFIALLSCVTPPISILMFQHVVVRPGGEFRLVGPA